MLEDVTVSSDPISTTEHLSHFQPIRRKGIAFSFGSLLLLGLLPIISNSRPGELDALDFAFYLSLWEFLCAWPLFLFELKSPNQGIFDKDVTKKMKDQTLMIVLTTGIIFSFSTFLYVLSFEKAGTVSAAIALQAYPLFSIGIERIFLGRKKTIGELGFTFLLITGIYYLGTEGSWEIKDFSSWFALALVVPLLWSIAHVTIKNTLDNSPITPNQITFLRVLVSSLVLFVVSLISNGSTQVIRGLVNTEFQFYALLMGLVYYLELVNWFYAIKHVDVSVASSITTPTPVITMILAVLILSESIEMYQIFAMFIVSISLYGLLYFGRKKI
ncbi:MAG: DMT family transporter [Candidatus Hodarchaeales archaeon]|jgi:drug/metabolite transporter (DMT)-like permease